MLLGRRRWHQFAVARHIYYYAAHVLTAHKGEAIGGLLNRDRTTSSYGHIQVKRRPAAFEPALSRVMARLSQQMEAA
jgi:chromosomal replication initiation ATPase DnaA